MNRLFTSLLLAFVLTCSLTTSLKGQVYFINENFSTATGSTPPSGWTNNTLVGDPSFDKFRFNNPAGRSTSSPISAPFAIFDSDNLSSGGGAEDATLESPVFNTTGYAGVTLQFDHYFQTGYGGTAIVELWDGSTWTQVYFNNSASTTNPKTEKINITSLAANKTGLKIRFRWKGDYSWWWLFDNVQVYYVVDVQPAAVTSPSTLCGLTNDSVRVQVNNNSGFTVTNVPVTVQLGGLLSGSATKTIASIPANGTTTIAFAGGSTINGGSVTVKAYTALTGDNTPGNDTILYSYNVIGTPQPPTVTTGSNCGPGKVNLSAAPILSTDSIAWFPTNSTAGAPLATTRAFTTPFINGTTTFYAAAVRGGVGGANSLATITTSGNAQQGIMFDIIPSKDIILDSLSLYLTTTYTSTGSYTYRVYYKTGTFIGSQTNSSAWTSDGDYNATFSSTGYLPFDINNITMYKGQTYGFYITIISGPGTSLDYTTLGAFTTYSNADVSIYAGNGVSGLFAGTFSPRGFNGKIHYKLLGCASAPVAVDAVIKPTASGTTISPKSGSKGFFKSGNLIDPDINASPDVMQFDIVNPTGFANSGYGTTWTITSTTVTTLGGYTVPSSMYTKTNPSASGNGGFNLNTDTTMNDSTIKISYVVKRLDNGCDTVIDRYVHIAPRPHVYFSFPNVCEGDKTSFDNYSTIQSGSLTYLWSFGNGGPTSIEGTPSVKLGAAGTYNVKLVVTSNYGYKDSLTRAVVVYKIPTSDFDFVNACEGTAITFVNKSTLPTGTPTYTWVYGDGSANGTTANTTKLYSLPGIYPSTLIVDVNGCKSSQTKYVTQAPRAIPTFTYSALTCDNAEVSFANTSTAPAFGLAAYSWDFGDGNVSSANNTSHTYGAFKTYKVTLTSSTTLGCIDSSSQTVTLLESPITNFSITGNTCTGDDITFANSTSVPAGTTVTYAWDFGDANQSSIDNPTHQYAGPGAKTVVLTSVSSNGCNGEKQMVININLKPNGDFVVNDVCQGDSTRFANNSSIADNTALTYSWDLDESKSSTDLNPSVKYGTAGAKNVTLTTTSVNGCTATATKTVNVNPVPVVDILSSSNLTQDGKFNFTTNASGAKYIWLFGDGGKDSSKSAQYQYLIDGVYEVKLVVISDKGCIGYKTGSVSVNRLGINSVSSLDGSVKMYPNPGTGNFALEFEGIASESLVSVAVLNNLGQKVADIDLNSIINNKVAVNISGMAAGIYFVQVETANGKAAFKYNLVK